MEASGTTSADRSGSQGGRTGRPYDHSSDALVLECALDLLAERDYEHLTLDEVARRTGKAKTTLYRRWATKEELVLAAIRRAGRPPEAAELPDLGSIRTDLTAVIDSPWLGGTERRLAMFAGLALAARSSDRLAAVINSEVTEPYVEVYRQLLYRAIERGEIAAKFAAGVPVLAEVIPAMSTHRLISSHQPVQREFFISVMDDVVLAAVGIATG